MSRYYDQVVVEDVAGPSRRSPERYVSAERNRHGSSITSQTSSTSLSTAFLHLDEADVAFFDAVIDQLTADASSFAELKSAYNRARSSETLVRPLDAARDATLWDTLLRLTHVRGRTWGNRWNAVREMLRTESQDERTDARLDTSDDDDDTPRRRVDHIEQERDSARRPLSWHTSARRSDVFDPVTPSSLPAESPSTYAQRRRHRSAATRPNEMEELRARMAALSAEANSLADSLEDGEPSVRQPILSSHRAQTSGTPRGMVNHQGRRLRFASADQEFELGKATYVESTTDEDDKGKARAGRRTSNANAAKRRFDEMVARSRHERDAAKHDAELKRELEEEERLSQAYVQADQLFSFVLKQRSLQWWVTLSKRHSKERNSAVAMYNRNVAGKAMAGWQRVVRRRRRGGESAAKVDVVRCKLNVWRTWTRKYSERRQTKREQRKMQLRSAFETTNVRLENRIVMQHYNRWRGAYVERRARNFRTAHLLSGSMSLWRIHLWRSSSTRAMEVQVVQNRNRKEIRTAFARWELEAKARMLWNVAKAWEERRTKVKTLDTLWRRSKEKLSERRSEAIADRWIRRRWREIAFARWRSKMKRVHDMEDVAGRTIAKREAIIRSEAFKTWILRERLCAWHRERRSHTLSDYLDRWCNRQVNLQERLESTEAKVKKIKKSVTLRRSFDKWRLILARLDSTLAVSTERHKRNVLRDKIDVWVAAMRRTMEQNRTAQDVCHSRLRKRTFETWKSKAQESRLLDFVEGKEQGLVRKTFRFWLGQALRRRSETLAVARFRCAVERRERKKALGKWTQTVIAHKMSLMQADDWSVAQIVRNAWQRWLDVCLRHEDMLSLSNSFLDVRREQKLRVAFKAWLSNAQTSQSRRLKAERFHAEVQRRKLQEMFRSWYARFAELSLHKLEVDLLFSRQATNKALIIQRWKAKTRSLPALRMDRARVTADAFRFWKAKLPFAKRERLATSHDRIEMQSKAFEHWKRMSKAKRAFRAAERFGGPSAARLRTFHRRVSPGSSLLGGGGAFGRTPRSKRRPITRSETRSDELTDVAGRGDIQSGRATIRPFTSHELIRSDGNDVTLADHSPSLSIRRWVYASSDVASEPDVIDVRRRAEEDTAIRQSRFRNLITDARRSKARTPSQVEQSSVEERSPSPASRTQSEATLRIRNSPRKGR